MANARINEAAPAQAAPLSRPVDLIVQVMAGAMVGVMCALLALSFALLVFKGPLEQFLPHGVTVALFGAMVMCLKAAIRRHYIGTLWQPQSIAIVLLSGAAGTVAASMTDAPTPVVMATLFALVSCASLATGGLMLAVGAARLAQIAKSVPYPVIGGFLAATGYYLLKNGVVLGASAVDAPLLSGESILRWAPPVVLGIAICLAARVGRMRLALPLGIGGFLAAFYIWLAATGQSIADAQAAGLMLGETFGTGVGLGQFPVLTVWQADWSVLATQVPIVMTIAALALLGALLNLSGIEHMSGDTLDLNRELTSAGWANVVSGFGAGFVGYQSPTMTQMAMGFAPGRPRLVALVAVVLTGGLLVFGGALLAFLPIGLFTLTLAYLGAEFFYVWLWIGARRMPRRDVVIVVAILAVAAFFGFAAAVAVGLIAASLNFTLSYARTEAVRARVSGRLRPSSVERGAAQAQRLAALGDTTAIYELQGFLFFGTAQRVLVRITDDLGDAAAPMQALVLDLRRVQGMDVSAVQVFERIARLAAQGGVSFYIAGAAPDIRRLLDVPDQFAGAHFRASLDVALTEIEAALIARDPAAPVVEPEPYAPELEALLRVAERLEPAPRLVAHDLPAGGVVFAQGDTDHSLVVLDSGRLSALVRGDDGSDLRVATFLPGAIVGEIAFVTGAPRTASVVADIPSRLRRITRADVDEVARVAPDVALAFQRHLAALLARRLARTTALLRALDR